MNTWHFLFKFAWQWARSQWSKLRVEIPSLDLMLPAHEGLKPGNDLGSRERPPEKHRFLDCPDSPHTKQPHLQLDINSQSQASVTFWQPDCLGLSPTVCCLAERAQHALASQLKTHLTPVPGKNQVKITTWTWGPRITWRKQKHHTPTWCPKMCVATWRQEKAN